MLIQLVEQVAARAELHDENEVGRGDEASPLVGDEGMRYPIEDLRLLHNVLHLAHRDNVRLLHLLECEDLARAPHAASAHRTERTFAERPFGHCEVTQRHRALRLDVLVLVVHLDACARAAGALRACVACLLPQLGAARCVLAHREQFPQRP